MDSAYWEQLQYVGDTRLMALITYMASRDPRLPVQAIEAIGHSAVDGLPRSRSPANRDQIIPPFALLWGGMLHDHWMWRPEMTVVQRSLPGVRGVLDWYAGFLGPDGLVGSTPGWPFVDWKPGLTNFPGGPEQPADHRCVISLLYVGALQQAADLEGALGDPARAQQDRTRAEQLTSAIRSQCWSAERGSPTARGVRRSASTPMRWPCTTTSRRGPSKGRSLTASRCARRGSTRLRA